MKMDEKQFNEAYKEVLTHNVIRGWQIQDAAEYVRKETNWQLAQGFELQYRFSENTVTLYLVQDHKVVAAHEIKHHMKVFNEMLAKAVVLADYKGDNEIADELSHVVSPSDFEVGQVVKVENEEQFKFVVTPAHRQLESDDEVVLDKYKDGYLAETDILYPKSVVSIVEDTNACY